MGTRRLVALTVFASLLGVSVAACSAFGTGDTSSTTTQTADAEAGAMPDAAASASDGSAPLPVTCGSGWRLAALSNGIPIGFKSVGVNEVRDGKLVSTATWAAGGGEQSFIETDVPANPLSIHAQYAMLMKGTDRYAEVGCHFDVIGSMSEDYPAVSLFFSHEADNRFFVQVDAVTGSGAAGRSSLENFDLGPASTSVVDMKTDVDVGKDKITGSVTVGGVNHVIDESFSFVPQRVLVMCGVYYASGDTAGTFVTEITNLDIEICPKP